jgi:hypothetical protein
MGERLDDSPQGADFLFRRARAHDLGSNFLIVCGSFLV